MYLLGLCYERSENIGGALAMYERVERNDPDMATSLHVSNG